MVDNINRSLGAGEGSKTGLVFTDSATAEKQQKAAAVNLAEQGFLIRLFVRRWLILLFAIIIFVLAFSYRLGWQAEALSLIAFAAGAALIPRSGIPAFSAPAVVVSYPKLCPFLLPNALMAALPEPCILLSQEGKVLSFNARAAELFTGLKTALHISAVTRNPQLLEAVRKCGPQTPVQTVTFTDRIPLERCTAATATWLDIPSSSETPEIFLYLRDLTEQRRLDQLRADFIANASHELKTPLASLLGFIETLQGAARDDKAARERFLAIMAKQAKRMARLIDNLMSLSRIEMRAHLKPQEVVAIPQLVSQACETLEPLASEANIELKIECETPGALVLGDPDELAQVFVNLIHNAIKYGRPGGSVIVRLRRERQPYGSAIAVAVEDNGPGIASLHLPRLTERFYRVPGPGSDKEGTGLGLAIVKHVLNRHRGELRIGSVEGAGSTFAVVLAEHRERTGADTESS